MSLKIRLNCTDNPDCLLEAERSSLLKINYPDDNHMFLLNGCCEYKVWHRDRISNKVALKVLEMTGARVYVIDMPARDPVCSDKAEPDINGIIDFYQQLQDGSQEPVQPEQFRAELPNG